MDLKPLIALALAGAWTSAAAADASDRRFDQLDRNHDGFLSRDEAEGAAELVSRFSELDVDNDDKLSRPEYRVVLAGEKQTLPGAPAAAAGTTRP